MGVAQKEEAFADVACADFRRRYDDRLNSVVHCFQVFDDLIKAAREMSGHVFAIDERSCGFFEDPPDVGPDVAGVIFTFAVPCVRKGLTGISGSEAMYFATPRFAVERSNVVPDRSLAYGRVRHPRHESGRGVTFPLDVTYSTGSRDGDPNTKFKASRSGTEGNSFKNS